MFKKTLLMVSAALGFSSAVPASAVDIVTAKTTPQGKTQNVEVIGSRNTNKIKKSKSYARSQSNAKRWPKPPSKATFKQNQRKQRKVTARKKAK